MITLNKKVSLLVASAIFVSPLLASADMSVGADGSVNMTSGNSSMSVGTDGNVNMTSDSKYQEYYKTFKTEFYEDLLKGNFENIDSKIKGYLRDIEYLKSNTDSLYYNNISIYELKLKVLTDLKNNFSKTKENIKTNLDEQKKKVGEIMKSLESDLKHIRENLTKENLVEMKAKAEELKTTYLAKVSEAFPNLDEAKKVIENRFKIFFNNQLIVREQIKEIKEKAKETASGTINKAKDLAKDAVEKLKETKKAENIQIKEENKQIKTDLKAKYKEKYIKVLKGKLDNLSKEKLQKIITNVEKKREIIATNEKIKVSTKEKYLAQLDALIEILKEKLNPSEEEELDVEKILDEASSSN